MQCLRRRRRHVSTQAQSKLSWGLLAAAGGGAAAPRLAAAPIIESSRQRSCCEKLQYSRKSASYTVAARRRGRGRAHEGGVSAQVVVGQPIHIALAGGAAPLTIVLGPHHHRAHVLRPGVEGAIERLHPRLLLVLGRHGAREHLLPQHLVDKVALIQRHLAQPQRHCQQPASAGSNCARQVAGGHRRPAPPAWRPLHSHTHPPTHPPTHR